MFNSKVALKICYWAVFFFCDFVCLSPRDACIDFDDTYFLSIHVAKVYKLQYLEFSYEISLSKCRTLKTRISVGIALQLHPGVIMLQHLRLRACTYSATPTPPNLLLSLLVSTLNNTDYNMERVHSTCYLLYTWARRRLYATWNSYSIILYKMATAQKLAEIWYQT